MPHHLDTPALLLPSLLYQVCFTFFYQVVVNVWPLTDNRCFWAEIIGDYSFGVIAKPSLAAIQSSVSRRCWKLTSLPKEVPHCFPKKPNLAKWRRFNPHFPSCQGSETFIIWYSRYTYLSTYPITIFKKAFSLLFDVRNLDFLKWIYKSMLVVSWINSHSFFSFLSFKISLDVARVTDPRKGENGDSPRWYQYQTSP